MLENARNRKVASEVAEQKAQREVELAKCKPEAKLMVRTRDEAKEREIG